MSPLSLRRYRAERLLRHEFEALRGEVLARVRGKLRAIGLGLDQGDLEAAYGAAWQGLYMATLEGQEIASPAGWLALVTFRRAVDEHRARARVHLPGEWHSQDLDAADGIADTALEGRIGGDCDLATRLDDRARLRQLFEGLCARLDAREREAAALCYLQGLSRSQAAARMGVSETRMRKLMEGRGPGRPGVASKVGALVASIRDGAWCEEQGSLMRALAYGILDPAGERYQLALAHHSQCPACRAYVVSLRGLAAALPPVLLPSGLGTEVIALSATGAAGAGGAAGGGWLLAGGGPLTAKLAVGCLLALGVGAGCVALDQGHRASVPARKRHADAHARGGAGAPYNSYQLGALAANAGRGLAPAATKPSALSALTPASRVTREFGPERALASSAAKSSLASSSSRTASASGAGASVHRSTAGTASIKPSNSAGGPASSAAGPTGSSSAGDSSAAKREFAPG